MVMQPSASAPLEATGSPTTAGAVELLLRHFHRQSPIRGGSLLITIFGDSIAPRGGAISLQSLIDLSRPFGLAERLVRTSVARLASDGWLMARRDGRRSEYRLAPGGQQRFAQATRRIYGEIPSSWSAQWTLLVLPPATGGRSQNVRDQLRWLGFGQISPGVFAHPSWSVEEARAALNGLDGGAEGLLFNSSSEGSDADRRLVTTGWDLGELARRYRKFVETFTSVATAALDRLPSPVRPTGSATPHWTDIQAAFVIRTLLVHEYRKIHLQDPLLPPALLPPDWVGATAYELSKRLYSAVFAPAEAYLSATANTMSAPLPPASAATYERFGGLTRPDAHPPR
jgi:phenylacetic acid degradation operon negative regulatory protein